MGNDFFKKLKLFRVLTESVNVAIKISKLLMDSENIDKEKSLTKLIEILKIVDLDFECLSCNKIRGGFLNDLTSRLQHKVLKRVDSNKAQINGKAYLEYF